MFRSILFTIISVFTLFAQEEFKDYLMLAFHEGRRQAVRSQMLPKSVAVFLQILSAIVLTMWTIR